MLRQLLTRHVFDRSRLFDHWCVVFVDGTVQENCRQGFGHDGKSSSGKARYRYVLQAMMLGPEGNVFPFLHEFVDLHNPQTQKDGAQPTPDPIP